MAFNNKIASKITGYFAEKADLSTIWAQ